MNIEKVYTKEQRYIMKMEAQNFIRRKYWVHRDDMEKVKKYLANLRAKRIV